MTAMLVVLAAWAAISLVIGLTVGRAIRQADSVEFPSRPAEWWVTPAASTEPDGAAAGDAEEVRDEQGPAREASGRVPHAA